MGRQLRQTCLCVLLTVFAWPAHAIDPVLMFLLSAARELITSAARERDRGPPSAAAVPAPLPSDRYPGTAVQPAQLRRVVDECFGYLSGTQRAEIFASLHATLLDPKNAAQRGAMIDYFITRAIAVREAQQRLAQLSGTEQEQLVVEFSTAVAAMPQEESEQLAELLRRRVLPVPDELATKLLAAISAR